MAITSQAALEIILQARDEASDALSGITGKLGGLGTLAGGAALAGVAAVGGGMALVGKTAFDFSQDVDAAMSLLQAQTGASAEEIAAFKDVALDVYSTGWGESVDDVAASMATVNTVLGITGEDLEAATQKALIMRDTFGTDVSESMAVVNQLMTTMGVSSDEAFDIVTTGLQNGLDVAGDFQDTINEYSGDFARLGFDAEGMLNILNAGLEAGAYNTDVIADGFREMNIRLMEGGDEVSAAFDAMGMDFERIQGFVASGDEVWGDYTADIVEGLLSIEDEVERNAAGVAIFGTKWEDIGGQVFLAAGTAAGGIDVVTGATDAAGESMSTGLGPAMESLKRTAETALVPVGDMLATALEGALPLFESAAAWLGDSIPVAIDWFKTKLDELQPVFDWLSEQFTNFKDTLFPKLEEAWGIVTDGFEAAKDLYNNELKPALEDLFDTLGLGTLDADGLGSSLGGIVGTMATWIAEGLIDTIKLGIEGLTTVVDLVTKGIEGWKTAWDNLKIILDIIKGVFDDVKTKINDLVASFGNLSLPDWLVPGSPTPLELGLRGISEAMDELGDKQLPGLTGGLNLAPTPGILAPAPVAAGMGAQQIVIHNYFGRDSVRSDDDVLDIARRQEEALLLRGVRSFPT